MSPELYRHAYLVRDIVRYRAAAIAARNVEWLGGWARERRVATSPQAEALRTLARELGVRVEIAATAPVFDDDDQADEISTTDHLS